MWARWELNGCGDCNIDSKSLTKLRTARELLGLRSCSKIYVIGGIAGYVHTNFQAQTMAGSNLGVGAGESGNTSKL